MHCEKRAVSQWAWIDHCMTCLSPPVTMGEMSRNGPHAPSGPWKAERPIHVAGTDVATFAVALDPSGKLHFQGGKLSGDHLIVLVGRDTPDSHLAELAAQYALVSRTLSLGDRACLALAKSWGATAWTADRIWAQCSLDVPVQLIRL